MTKPDDQKTPWRSITADFGEDLAPIQFKDQPGEPGPRSTAATHARKTKLNEAAARQAQDLREIDGMVQEQREEDALADIIHRRRLGSKIPRGTMALAQLALARRGTDLSTSEQLAAKYLER